jgi:hypothetical protein
LGCSGQSPGTKRSTSSVIGLVEMKPRGSQPLSSALGACCVGRMSVPSAMRHEPGPDRRQRELQTEGGLRADALELRVAATLELGDLVELAPADVRRP